MTLTAQSAVLTELAKENNRMRALLAEILEAEDALIDSMTVFGFAPRQEMFPFTERIRAIVRPPVVYGGAAECVTA